MTKPRSAIDSESGRLVLTFDSNEERHVIVSHCNNVFRLTKQFAGDVAFIRVIPADDDRPIEKGVHLLLHCLEERDTPGPNYTFRFAVTLQRDVARALAENIMRNADATIVLDEKEYKYMHGL